LPVSWSDFPCLAHANSPYLRVKRFMERLLFLLESGRDRKDVYGWCKNISMINVLEVFCENTSILLICAALGLSVRQNIGVELDKEDCFPDAASSASCEQGNTGCAG
uniref:RUN domain-containing protein n=1 Tax=Gongylonema pulchrum TaxID=637853 RepID=A0A183DFB2_9BILA